MAEIKTYKERVLPSNPRPNAIYWIKASNASDVIGYITDINGVPYPLKDISGSGGITTLTNTDGNLVITGADNKVINLAPALLSSINSALQSGDNISELVNDSGFLTTETDPIFQASEASNFVAGDKANLDNQSGSNTGDETTSSIQTKRPLKTINGESLEGTGNVTITIPTITKTSDLTNDGEDGINPFITANDLPTVPDFADQTETNEGTVSDKTIAPNTLAGWWTYVKGLAQTFAEKITFSLGALFTPQVAPTYERGRIYFDDVNDCISFMDSISGTSVQVGYEMLMRARNNTGSTIPNGAIVYISGAIGQNPTIALAQSNTEPTSEIIGIATHNIENNTVGKVCVFGLVNDINTSAFNDGDFLYLSSSIAGGLTATPPASPNYVVSVGVVEHSHVTQGKILVKPQRALSNNNTLGTSQKVSVTENVVKVNLDTKLDKSTTPLSVYATDALGNQEMKLISELGSSLESVTISNRWTLTIANVYYRSRGDFGGFNVDTLNISTASAVIVTNVASNSSAFYCTSKSKALKKIYIDGSNIVSTLTDFKLGVFAFQRANSVTPTAINIITIGEFTLTKASGDGCHFWEITPTNLEIPAGYLVSCVLMRTGGTGTEINCNMTFKFDDYVA